MISTGKINATSNLSVGGGKGLSTTKPGKASFSDELKMAMSSVASGKEKAGMPDQAASPLQKVDSMVDKFINEAPLTSYQKMILSTSAGYEKQKLIESGQNPANVDIRKLFSDIVETAASVEDTALGSVNNKASTLHRQLADFLAKYDV